MGSHRALQPGQRRKRAKTGGGRGRGQHEVQDLTEQVEYLMLHGQGRQQLARSLGKYLQARGWQETDAPVPLPTVDAYIRRVNERWREESAPRREEERRLQRRRLMRDLLQARADKRHTDAIRLEALASKVLGTEAPSKDAEAVMAAAKILLESRLAEARAKAEELEKEKGAAA
jgi:hypothetical protein